MGYPRLVEKDHSCLPGAYETVENDWIRGVADSLATEMKGAAEQDGGTWAVFADPRADSDGKPACGSPETVNALVENGREKADKESPDVPGHTASRSPPGAGTASRPSRPAAGSSSPPWSSSTADGSSGAAATSAE